MILVVKQLKRLKADWHRVIDKGVLSNFSLVASKNSHFWLTRGMDIERGSWSVIIEW